MKLMTDWCCAANASMFLRPSSSVSPNAYRASLVENKLRASANVIHPRSSGGNADKERASVASVVPSSFMASDGAAASAPNNHLIIPIVEVSCGLIFDHTARARNRLKLVLWGKHDRTPLRARRLQVHESLL